MIPMTEDERISKASTNAIVRWLRHIRAEERRRMHEGLWPAAAEGGEGGVVVCVPLAAQQDVDEQPQQHDGDHDVDGPAEEVPEH